ncbi:unnamed protein product [Psylliodes chrysocephalus]|uniref:Uncharacterized protein n=1 Tax=Psylliodes chrysocephalus TaxID=3402493 RepID=A0A9P0G824_9CUCU|nr:unnamed protein product [Psylliodes chrysocephala]
MTWIVRTFFVLLGFTLAVKADLDKQPVSKLVILSGSPIAYGYMTRMKQNIINSCKENGHNIENDLEKTYDDLVNCVNKTTLYVEKKKEYLKNLDDCSKLPIQKAKHCLTKEQQYYPDVLLKIAKSQINFICDHYETIKNDLISCVKTYEKQDVRSQLSKCISDINGSVKDTSPIPSSFSAFCQKYSPSHRCFSDILNKECKQYPKLKQFGDDYNLAMSFPCTQKSFNM